MPDHHALVTVSQAATILGKHRNTIERAIKRGDFTIIWAPGDHGPTRHLPRWQVDGLPPPPDWNPDDYAGDNWTHEPTSAPETALAQRGSGTDLAPLLAGYDRLIADLRALERDHGAKTERIAALERDNATLRAEMDAIKQSAAQSTNAPHKRSWRFWEQD